MRAKFPKDVVIIDFEFTKKDAIKALPTQLGAVLLDGVTLDEKDSFSSYIQANLGNADPESLAISGINEEKLKNAPMAGEVGRMFLEKFGVNVLLACWVSSGDQIMFRRIMDAAGIDLTRFDYHMFDIWPPAYLYLLGLGYSGSERSEEMFRAFGLPKRGGHDALEDCRLAARVLRKISE